MGDLGGLGMRRQPTAAEVVGRLKDDGDLDALRRAIVRKVKGNVCSYFGPCTRGTFRFQPYLRTLTYAMYCTLMARVLYSLQTWVAPCLMEMLRNNIIREVKQSMVINEEGSEKLKLKELSDAIYQDIGSKIMGQISDEVWSVIQSNETDIRGTVEGVYNRIMNPEQQQDTEPSSKKLKRNVKEEQVSPANASTSVTIQLEDDDPEEPPGFGFNDHQRNNIIVTQQQPLSVENNIQVKPNEGEPVDAGSLEDGDDEDPDVPPGFG